MRLKNLNLTHPKTIKSRQIFANCFPLNELAFIKLDAIELQKSLHLLVQFIQLNNSIIV